MCIIRLRYIMFTEVNTEKDIFQQKNKMKIIFVISGDC